MGIHPATADRNTGHSGLAGLSLHSRCRRRFSDTPLVSSGAVRLNNETAIRSNKEGTL